jgi:hypothetical protein
MSRKEELSALMEESLLGDGNEGSNGGEKEVH